MRPVNLIPSDERRGDSAPLRTGTLVYVLVGGMVLLLLGIVAVALTGKQISDRQSEKAGLVQELAAATARANSVQAFTNFRTVQENRAATVASLAESRFDWPRVLHELALVLPSDVELSSLTGSVAPDAQVSSSGGGGSSLRAEVQGPALEIVGCASSQDSVAAFVSALEDIDGVTRVGVDTSKLPEETTNDFTGEPGNGTSTGTDGTGDCQSGPTIAKFTIIAAFDAVPTPSTASAAPSVPAAGATQATASDQVADAQSEQAVAKASAQAQISKAQNAKSTVLPGG